MTGALRFCLVLAPALLACASLPARRAPAPRDEGPCECAGMPALADSEFGYYAASDEPAPGFDRTWGREGRLVVHTPPDPAVDLSHLAGARVRINELGETVLSPILTPDGARAMRELTESRVGEPIAVVLDGELLGVRRVLTPASDCVIFFGLSEEQACRIACAAWERADR